MTAPTDRRVGVIDRLTTRLTRRGLTKTGSFMLAGAASGHAELLRTSAQTTLAVAETINVAITLEAFAVTFYGAARSRSGELGLDDNTARFARTSQCEEEAHYHFFEAAGAVPSTTTFTIDDSRITNQQSLLNAVQEFESILVGAYMSAGRKFAMNGESRLMEIAYQAGAVEAQHQAIARVLGGERVPGDRAFARWMFAAPEEAIEALAALGYIKGSGSDFTFPGPVDRNCRGVTGLVPETTEDQPADPGPAATPVGDFG